MSYYMIHLVIKLLVNKFNGHKKQNININSAE